MPKRLARAALVVACSACSAGDPSVVHDPYDGPAPYPDTRTKVAWPDGDFAVVPASGADFVTVFDLAGGRGVASAPVGRNPVALDGPHQIVGDRPRGVAYAVLSYPGSAESAGQHSHGESALPGWIQKLALDDLRPIGEVRLDPNPGEAAVSEDGKRLVVTQFDLARAAAPGSVDAKRADLTVIDPSQMLPFGTPEPDKLLVCVAPHGVALSRPDGAKAFVACYGEDAIAIVDLVDVHAPVVRVPVGASPGEPGKPRYGPYEVALSPSGRRLAIASRESRDLRFFDVTTGATTSLVVALDGAPGAPVWSADEARVWVPIQARDGLAQVDATTGAIKVTPAPVGCAAPVDAALVGAGVAVVCEGAASQPGALFLVDGATGDARPAIAAGQFPGRPMFGRGR